MKKITYLALAVLIFASSFCGMLIGSGAVGGASAITYDTLTTDQNTSASSLTFSHTLTSGSNRFIVVLVGVYQSGGGLTDAITGVTYNSVGLTRINSYIQVAYYQFAMYYSASEPTAGAHDVVVTLDGSHTAVAAIAITYTGVDTTSPIGDNTFSGSSATSHSDAITTTSTSEIVVSGIFGGTENFVLGGGHTQRGEQVTDTNKYIEGSEATGTGGDVTMSWTTTGSTVAAHGGVTIKPAI